LSGLFFFDVRLGHFFLITFLSSSYQETPKDATKKIAKGFLDARPRENFVIAFFSSPYREALNQRNKKSHTKKSPVNFWETHSIFSPVFSNCPCRETPKYALRKKKEDVFTYFFWRAGADVRRVVVIFFLPPLGH
jgi:hypothetical protein